MTAAERHAIKVLVDRAKRSALAGQAVHAARLHRSTERAVPSPGSTLHARPLRSVHDMSSVHDETWDDSQAYLNGVIAADIGANNRSTGRGLPSQRKNTRRAA